MFFLLLSLKYYIFLVLSYTLNFSSLNFFCFKLLENLWILPIPSVVCKMNPINEHLVNCTIIHMILQYQNSFLVESNTNTESGLLSIELNKIKKLSQHVVYPYKLKMIIAWLINQNTLKDEFTKTTKF